MNLLIALAPFPPVNEAMFLLLSRPCKPKVPSLEKQAAGGEHRHPADSWGETGQHEASVLLFKAPTARVALSCPPPKGTDRFGLGLEVNTAWGCLLHKVQGVFTPMQSPPRRCDEGGGRQARRKKPRWCLPACPFTAPYVPQLKSKITRS